MQYHPRTYHITAILQTNLRQTWRCRPIRTMCNTIQEHTIVQLLYKFRWFIRQTFNSSCLKRMMGTRGHMQATKATLNWTSIPSHPDLTVTRNMFIISSHRTVGVGVVVGVVVVVGVHYHPLVRLFDGSIRRGWVGGVAVGVGLHYHPLVRLLDGSIRKTVWSEIQK